MYIVFAVITDNPDALCFDHVLSNLLSTFHILASLGIYELSDFSKV